jgi:DNA-directed RNA polymerase subunit beta'
MERRRSDRSTPRSAACCSTRSCPRRSPFDDVNKVMGKKELGELIDLVLPPAGNKATVLCRPLRTLGYEHATRAGISICIDDMVIPDAKAELLDEAQAEVERSRSSTTRA